MMVRILQLGNFRTDVLRALSFDKNTLYKNYAIYKHYAIIKCKQNYANYF